MEYVYNPAIDKLCEPLDRDFWGKCNDESRIEFLSITSKFTKEVSEAIDLMTPGQELFKLDPEELAKYETESAKIEYYNRKFSQWIDKIKKMLNDDSE